ncbi:4Fe-4S binding protein [Crateriforma conspicua]|uniref:Putative electron transport protein YccM n=1 Tax=Crateriforma conspicua TaxID=2527996 RepID=A0A5C6FVS6_9PLAN|nr:4Fe-4S binding protein [Crateriforma conspicua]TWU65438.1 putative electron transport protein YccM [Crateriforma conspicua]
MIETVLVAGIGESSATLQAFLLGNLIPTPQFSDHAIPVSEQPAASGFWWECLDLSLLLVALALASYFALVSRSRRSLFGLSAFSLVWFGFIRQGCVCSVGSVQNVAYAMTNASYAVPLTVIGFFCLPILFALYSGRVFCSGVCPLGAIQEMVAVRNVQIPKWIDHGLGVVPWIYLGAAVIFAASGGMFLICRYDPFVGFFRFNGNAGMILFGTFLLLVGVFVGRPYCRFLCPYGALLSACSGVARSNVQIPPGDCIRCGLCRDACPYGAIEPPSETATDQETVSGKRRLIFVFAATPVLIIGLAIMGYRLGPALSGLEFDVQLASQLQHEAADPQWPTNDASDAFRAAQGDADQLLLDAVETQHRYRYAGVGLGVWIALVVVGKSVSLCRRRQQDEFVAGRSACVSCGRCFEFCPVEHAKQGVVGLPTIQGEHRP